VARARRRGYERVRIIRRLRLVIVDFEVDAIARAENFGWDEWGEAWNVAHVKILFSINR